VRVISDSPLERSDEHIPDQIVGSGRPSSAGEEAEDRRRMPLVKQAEDFRPDQRASEQLVVIKFVWLHILPMRSLAELLQVTRATLTVMSKVYVSSARAAAKQPIGPPTAYLSFSGDRVGVDVALRASPPSDPPRPPSYGAVPARPERHYPKLHAAQSPRTAVLALFRISE